MSFEALIAHPFAIASAILLIGAAASGVHLYATLGALGIASRMELIPALPPGLSGLENNVVLTTAAVLLLIEALADREPAFAGMWHTLHALVKPLAAGLLTLSAISGVPVRDALVGCALAALTALVFHAMRYGIRIAARMPNAPRGSFPWSIAEAALAVALLVPLGFPQVAVPTAAVLALFMLVAGPLGVRAFRLGVSAQRARLRSFLGEAGWVSGDDLPESIRRTVRPTPLGGTPPRGLRAGVLEAPGLGRFQRGWLVAEPGGHRLLAGSWRGRRQVEIGPGAVTEWEPGSWADLLRVETAAGKLQILLLKDGPAPALVMRSLAAEPPVERRVQG